MSRQSTLALFFALISQSYKDKPIDEKTICFGEVGLSGEVRAVNMAEQRVQEAKKLGFEVCILPEVCRKSMTEVKGIRLVGVSNLLLRCHELSEIKKLYEFYKK